MSLLVQKLYKESWEEEKTLFFPYSDSPELRRVAKAQEVLSDVRSIHSASGNKNTLNNQPSHVCDCRMGNITSKYTLLHI